MKWYDRWYIQLPVGWFIVILLLAYIFPPSSEYEIPSRVGIGLFTITLCVAALNHDKKRKEKKK